MVAPTDVRAARARRIPYMAWGICIGIGSISCSTSPSCFRSLGAQFNYAGSDSCAVTVTAGSTTAEYTFRVPPAGAPPCTETSTDACTVVRGPSATCGRSSTCVAISFTGANADALRTFLNSDNKPVTTVLQCGTNPPSTQSSSISCGQGI